MTEVESECNWNRELSICRNCGNEEECEDPLKYHVTLKICSDFKEVIP